MTLSISSKMITIINTMNENQIYSRKDLSYLIKEIPAMTIFYAIKTLMNLGYIIQVSKPNTKPSEYQLTERGIKLKEILND